MLFWFIFGNTGTNFSVWIVFNAVGSSTEVLGSAIEVLGSAIEVLGSAIEVLGSAIEVLGSAIEVLGSTMVVVLSSAIVCLDSTTAAAVVEPKSVQLSAGNTFTSVCTEVGVSSTNGNNCLGGEMM